MSARTGYPVMICGDVPSDPMPPEAPMLWPKSAHRPLDIASASVARLTLLYIWRPRSTVPQRSSALGGFLMPGDVTFEAPVAPLVLAHSLAPFDLRI